MSEHPPQRRTDRPERADTTLILVWNGLVPDYTMPEARKVFVDHLKNTVVNVNRLVDFGTLMGQFLDSLPDGGLVMCHPGFVDDVLVSLDPLTTQREHEHKYLASEDFPRLLAANKVTLG